MTFNFKVIFNNELDGNVIKILNFKKKILKKKFNTRQISVYINIYILNTCLTFDKQFDKYRFNMADQISNNNIDEISKRLRSKDFLEIQMNSIE